MTPLERASYYEANSVMGVVQENLGSVTINYQSAKDFAEIMDLLKRVETLLQVFSENSNSSESDLLTLLVGLHEKFDKRGNPRSPIMTSVYSMLGAK